MEDVRTRQKSGGPPVEATHHGQSFAVAPKVRRSWWDNLRLSQAILLASLVVAISTAISLRYKLISAQGGWVLIYDQWFEEWRICGQGYCQKGNTYFTAPTRSPGSARQ